MLHLALLLQLTVGVDLTAEGWIAPADGYAHRVLATADVDLRISRVLIHTYADFIWWAASDTFPLMAQAGAALERQHGASVKYDLGPCAVGAWVGRRAIQGLNNGEPEWGINLAYWDGVAPAITCSAEGLTVHATGPMQTWHPLHLPYPLYRARVALDHDRWKAVLRGAFAAQPRDCTAEHCQERRLSHESGTELEMKVGYSLDANIEAGVTAGRLHRPGYGPPIRRFALYLRLGS